MGEIFNLAPQPQVPKVLAESIQQTAQRLSIACVEKDKEVGP